MPMMARVMEAYFGRVGHAVHEAAIDLQRGDGQILEIGEARVAGAEVVHRDAQPAAAQLAQDLGARGSAISRFSVISSSMREPGTP